MRVVLVTLIGLIGGGCATYRNHMGGVNVAFIRTGDAERPLPPAVPPTRVRVLPVGQVQRGSRELGFLEVYQAWVYESPRRYLRGTTDGFLSFLRIEAGKRGCDAIVLHEGCIHANEVPSQLRLPGGGALGNDAMSLGNVETDFARVGATCIRLPADAHTEPELVPFPDAPAPSSGGAPSSSMPTPTRTLPGERGREHGPASRP